MKLISWISLIILLSYSSALRAESVDIKKLKQEIKSELREEMREEIKKELRKELEKEVRDEINQPPKTVKQDSGYEEQKPSEDKDSSWTDRVKFSGQVRVRPEVRRNLTQTVPAVPGRQKSDFSVLLRSRLGVEFKATDNMHFFIQGQDSREFGEEVAAVPSAAGDDEGFDLHQGYIDLINIGDSDLSIRLGRQEVELGDQRLLGSVGWSNVGRSLDGIVVKFDKPKFSITGLGAITNRTTTPGDGQYLAGLYGNWKGFPGGDLDLYYLMLHDGDGATGGAAGAGNTLSVHTIGTRIKAKYENGVDFGIESAVQLGKFGSNSILAFAEHGHLGYTFPVSWQPRIGLEYNYATGDDPASTRYTKFNNLLPTNHNKYGFMDLASWSNLHDGVVSFSVKPADKWFVGLDYHLLMVDKNNSAGDSFATYTGAPGAGKIAGHELDLLVKWDVNKYLKLMAGYSHFFRGSFLSNQGLGSDADFFYIQTLAEFK